MALLIPHNPGCSDREKLDLMFSPDASPIPILPLPALLPFPPFLLPQRLLFTLSTLPVGVESVGKRSWNAGPARSRPLAFQSSSFPSLPIRPYSGIVHDHPNATPPLSFTHGHRMPANGVGNATRLAIFDLSLAPKTAKRSQPSLARDASDIDGYLRGMLTAPEREFSRVDICFSALTINVFTFRRNTRFPALPCAQFIQTRRRWVRTTRCFGS